MSRKRWRQRRLVIFIDDIDRCDAPKAVEMLEAVNYLAESGPCVIVLGLAEDVVAQQVALHFKDIAAMETPAPAAGDKSQAQRYAERYLEKIINLRVRVPQLDQERLKALLDLEPKPKTWERWFTDAREAWRRRGWPIATACIALVFAVLLGAAVHDYLAAWQTGREENGTYSEKAVQEELDKLREAAREASRRAEYATTDAIKLEPEPVGSEPKTTASEPNKVDSKPTSDADTKRQAALKAMAVRDLARLAAEEAGDVEEAAQQGDRKRATKAADRAKVYADKAEVMAGMVSAKKDDGKANGQKLPNAGEAAAREAPERAVQRPEAASAQSPPWWPVALVLAPLLVIGGAIARRSRQEIVDTPGFVKALEILSPLLLSKAHGDIPREIRRFENLARYVAMQLRKDRDIWRALFGKLDGFTKTPATATPAGPVSIPEDMVVVLAAIRHVYPNAWAILRGKAATPAALSAFISQYQEAAEKHGLTPWPDWNRDPGSAWIRRFQEVMGETDTSLRETEVTGETDTSLRETEVMGETDTSPLEPPDNEVETG